MHGNDDFFISVQDVYNVIAEHMNKLDELWPEADIHGPRKVHIVELLDAIKLRLVARAEKNANKYESPFERAAKKITGSEKPVIRPKIGSPAAPEGKTAMQLAHEAAQARIKKT